ncbi:hypothetical protein [Thermaerobacillus caldiproteolyticus]|uniref:hypothetical protein n=1 Tax=Thermaerobacillus caldiproteolyticus TaxID=247480 RepID=UPI00188CA1C9|nr:hypothetical protein [Anoxybacillus caldiproteolyticus]QPA31116.1 hypothetical protein ISX45_16710 [Anoxybacillus caldiproteolyticus]
MNNSVSFNYHTLNFKNVQRIPLNQTALSVKIKNASSITLDKLTLSDVIGNVTTSNQRIKVTEVKGEEQQNSDYDQYFSSFFENLEGVSEEEKNQLSGLVKAALKYNGDYFSSWTSDKASMYYLQTQEKLNLIADNVASGSIKDQLKAITKQYTSDKLKQIVNASLETYQIIYDRFKGKGGPYSEIANQMKNAIEEIQNGNHADQVSQQQLSQLFSGLNTNSSFQIGYEKIMRGYKEIEKGKLGKYWNKFSEADVDKTINMLREDWNDFVSQFQTFEPYRVSIDSQSRIDMKI